MNEHNHNWLNDIPLSDDVWLEMLVDGELTAQQRTTFVAHIRETDAWQQLATAFLDNQVMAQTVPFENEPPATVSPRDAGDRVSWHRSLVVAVACLVCGLFFGSMMPHNGHQSPGQVATRNTPDTTPGEVPIDSPIESRQTNVARATLPALYQVRDTPDEAVYYVDCQVPQFLLESLVLAGHNVKLEQDFLGYTESPDSPAAVPINVLRIEKYGRLMASAEPNAADINQP